MRITLNDKIRLLNPAYAGVVINLKVRYETLVEMAGFDPEKYYLVRYWLSERTGVLTKGQIMIGEEGMTITVGALHG